jgi:hypothetical protein
MKKSVCKRLFKGIGYCAVILVFLSSCKNSGVEKLQSEIDRIAVKWVPDHRVGICNIRVTPGDKGTKILAGETTNANAKNDIIKTLNNQGILLTDSVILLPDTLKNNKYSALVTLSVINLRKEPEHVSELVSQALLGTPVLILKSRGSWVLIQTPDNYISWTEQTSVRALTRSEMEAWKMSARVIYLENTGWLYDTTSAQSGVVGDLAGGDIMEKTGEINGFVRVVLPDGRKGYVDKQKVFDFNTWKSSVSDNEDNICRVARSFTGVPYLWGGSSVKGVDCSGFVQSVYFRNGLILARDASLQALHGSPVDITSGFGNLRKGDLLFFGSKEKGVSHVTHVAIYLGNSDYINSSGRVIVNSLDSTKANYVSYRMNTILMAKRIIGVENEPGIVPVNKHPWY